MINGRPAPLPIELVAGATHRLRLINIGALARRRLRLLDGDAVLRWTPVAKDAAEFPVAQRSESVADQTLAPGETMDVLVTPMQPGNLVLEVTTAYGVTVVMLVPVRVGASMSALARRQRHGKERAVNPRPQPEAANTIIGLVLFGGTGLLILSHFSVEQASVRASSGAPPFLPPPART